MTEDIPDQGPKDEVFRKWDEMKAKNAALEAELDERQNEIAALKQSIVELQEIYKAENAVLRAENERLTRKRLKTALHDEAACLLATLMPLLHMGEPSMHKGDNWQECDAPVCKIATRICSQDTTMTEQLMERNRDILKENEELKRQLSERLEWNETAIESCGIASGEIAALRQRCERAEIDSENYFRLAEELRQRCEALEEGIRTAITAIVDHSVTDSCDFCDGNPCADNDYYHEPNCVVSGLNAALSHPSVVDPQPQSIIDKPGSGDNDKVDP